MVGSEEVIEEAFVDVFCDLVYGGGWMDLERYEELDRDCNWALVSNFHIIWGYVFYADPAVGRSSSNRSHQTVPLPMGDLIPGQPPP